MAQAADGTSPVFAYQAQTAAGEPLSGTIDAPGVDEADRRLRSLGLRVTRLEPAAAPVRPRPIRGDDFIAFNQQLAQLAAANLPIDQGLRLIAQDMGSRRHAVAIRQIADELERGRSLGEAFSAHAGQFPALYGRLVDAGVKAGDLCGVLMNMGRHAELVQRLRAAIWRAAAYPLLVLAVLFVVMMFISRWLLPPLQETFTSFRVRLPWMTRVFMQAGDALGTIGAVGLAILATLIVATWIVRRTSAGRVLAQALALRLPLIGPLLRTNLVARWCDALHLAVAAGLDLPAAIALASDVVDSRPLAHDGRALTEELSSGRPLGSAPRYALLPALVPAAMRLASDQHELPEVLGRLARMYQSQSEGRLRTLPAILSLLLLLLITSLAAFAIVATLAPLLSLIQTVAGGSLF